MTSFQVVQNEQRIGSIGSLQLFRRNGESFQANLRIIPIVNDGTLNNIIILFHDLSEQEEYRLKNQQLEQKIHALKNNPEAVERQARDQLHLAKPGELIYMLPDKKPAQTADTAPQTSPAPGKPQR